MSRLCLVLLIVLYFITILDAKTTTIDPGHVIAQKMKKLCVKLGGVNDATKLNQKSVEGLINDLLDQVCQGLEPTDDIMSLLLNVGMAHLGGQFNLLMNVFTSAMGCFDSVGTDLTTLMNKVVNGPAGGEMMSVAMSNFSAEFNEFMTMRTDYDTCKKEIGPFSKRLASKINKKIPQMVMTMICEAVSKPEWGCCLGALKVFVKVKAYKTKCTNAAS